MDVDIRRVYDPQNKGEGLRVLIDRLWPRGVRKDDLQYDLWEKEIAPTPALRKWFGHSPERWEAFGDKYRKELDSPRARERLEAIAKEAGKRKITLLYGARDPEHNHALILADVLRKF